MKSEKDVKAAVKKTLCLPGAVWHFMPAANGFGMPGIFDFVGCANGAAFGVETKFGSGKRTAWQEKQAAAFEAAGGKYWLINEKNVEDFAVSFSQFARECAARNGIM
jgi:hypothetical protein